MDRYSVALLLFFKRIKKLIADHIIQQKWLVLPVLFTMALNPLHSQNSLNGDEIEQYRKQAQQLVSFLEFTFNTIGDREVSVNEKDIIINESYAKIFDNEKVQIEDDLDENRQVPINKNVQGYMKDIDFFFHEVSFKFEVQEIDQQVNEKNQVYFKITLNRNLQGVTIEGDSINTNRVRYIEINLDEVQKDLKIASIYTTKLNERQELQKWWSELPLRWKEILGAGIALNDTLRMKDVLSYNDSLAKLNWLVERVICRDTLTLVKSDALIVALSDSALVSLSLLDRQLKRITRIDTIDISGRSEIISLEPLSRLTHLRKLNCSHTLVMSLMPLRNLTHLEVLDCSHTPVDNIAALRYTSRLEELILNDTWIDRIKTISNFWNLQKLHINATKVDSLDPLAKLSNLKDLEFAGTNIVSLEPLKGLTNLERFDFSDTRVKDITPLNGLVNTYFLKFENTPVEDLWPLKDMSRLQLLFINKTKVNNLDPLNDLPDLTVVYCDQTGITREKANIFMEQNQNVLVVYESADLHFWWTSLSSHWKGLLAGRFSISGIPSREQLHQITRIKQLDLSKYPLIQTLDPLLKLPLLNELDCHNTGISDLSPIESLLDLKKLNILGTRVVNLTPLSRLTKLETLNFDNTDVNNISPLINLSDLRTIYCDKTLVLPEDIISFMGGHMDCMVVYQTESLELWWNSLLGIWKTIMDKMMGYNLNASIMPNREQLQSMVNLRRINLMQYPEFSDSLIQLKNLDYIVKYVFLEELRFTKTGITRLDTLRNLKYLKVLSCPNNPIETLEPVSEFSNLTELDIQNTPVRSLGFLGILYNLKKLNCSGTLIKDLKGLEHLVNLEQLECYNTKIRNLKWIENLKNLKIIRCSNTKISSKKIQKFKDAHPGVEVVYF